MTDPTPEAITRPCGKTYRHEPHDWEDGRVWHCPGHRDRPEAPTAHLEGETTPAPLGTEITTPGEFAAKWNSLDEHGREAFLDTLRTAARRSLDCYVNHSQLAAELEGMRRLHEHATIRATNARIALGALIETARHIDDIEAEPALLSAIATAREVLTSIEPPAPRDDPAKLRAALEGLIKPAAFVYNNVWIDEPAEGNLAAALDAAQEVLAS